MATLSKGQTFGSTETVTAEKLHALVDSATITGIVNADISAAANIDSSKLNLASAGYLTSGQSTATITGNWEFDGSCDFDGNVTFAGVTIASLGSVTTCDINGGSIDGVTIGAAMAPTVTNLGTVTTADINGGTLDGVQIGGTTATGELIVNNSSDAADGLGSQGTSGQFLTSAGAGANPTWTTQTKAALGSWADAAFNTSTLMSTDGFVCCVSKTPQDGDVCSIKTNSTNPPTVVRAAFHVETNNDVISCMCPVKSGEYYLIEGTTSSRISYYIIPLS